MFEYDYTTNYLDVILRYEWYIIKTIFATSEYIELVNIHKYYLLKKKTSSFKININ